MLLRELIAGSTRFNDLRRGVPRMSPALLSRRLKDLEGAGILRRVESRREKGVYEYQLTPAGRDLQPVVESIGFWGQKWVEAGPSLKNLDPSLLMWDMRRNLDPTPLPDDRSVIQFMYSDLPPHRRSWWLIVEADGDVDLCNVDPGFEVDLYVSTDVETMTRIWMGLSSVRAERNGERLSLIGDKGMARTMQRWLGLSPFAVERKKVKDRATA